MKKTFWTSEKLLSTAAVLISICTFIVFVYQTNLVRKQQYMSVFPYLTMANHHTGLKNYTFIMQNDGIGPALITSVKVEDKNGKLYSDIVDYVRASLAESDSVGFYYSNISKGRLIPEGEIIELIGVSDKKVSSGVRLAEILNPDSLKIEIEYESIYGERWVITDEIGYPKKK